MSYLTPDAYYQPESFGLTMVHEIDGPDACYSFDMFVLWRHADGRLFYATDSGCSCPSPFEDFTSLADLSPLTDDTWGEFSERLNAWCQYDWRDDDDPILGKVRMLRHEMMVAAVKAMQS